MPASFLKIGGELVQGAILQLVEVTQELNHHWWCSVECRQTEDRRIPVEDLLGQDLQIVTRDQAGAEHVVFDGFILEAGLLYEVFGSYTARIKAVTRSYKLELSAQEAYYRKQTISGVVQALCGVDGLTASVRVKDGPPRNYVQWGEPDFPFLVRLADDHQAWIRPSATGIEVCDSFQAGAKVTWRQEDGLLEFEVEGALAPATFDGTHFDPRQMRSITHAGIGKPADYYASSAPFVATVAKESKGQFPPGAAVLDERAATADEYQSLLERESLRAAAHGVTGHGVSQKEDLRAGDTIEIVGVLDGKGTYGLTKVVHRWGRDGYRNEFRCTPAKIWLSAERPAQTEIAGVVTARVVDQNDPRQMGRVQVQYDWQENGPTGWIRATTPHAGQDRGFLFLPEIGDEVVVAFEHGDPERPYVVGSLWNGVDTAPREEFWGEDVAPNDIKRIVTKSGHRVQLVDKPGKESIVIATPQRLKISLIEKTDETGRSAILLHSDGDIFINAPGGRVHLRSASLSEEVGGNAPVNPVGQHGSTTSGSPSASLPPHPFSGPLPPPESSGRLSAPPSIGQLPANALKAAASPIASPTPPPTVAAAKTTSSRAAVKALHPPAGAPPVKPAPAAKPAMRPVTSKAGPPTSSVKASASSAPPKKPVVSPRGPLSSTAAVKKIACELAKATIKCAHGRQPSTAGLLEVVPAEVGDTVSLTAKINGGCGKHPEWRISGYRTFTAIGTETSFTANHWRMMTPGVWGSHIVPHTYNVSASGCAGAGRDWQVKAYPSDELSLQIDSGRLLNAKKRLDWAIENVLGAFLVNPEFKLLQGAGKLTAGWKEYADHRAFYKYDAQIGFAPLIGAQIRIPFGPGAAIPRWLKKYGDAYFFVEFKGGIDVNAHWARSTPDSRHCFADATGSIEGAIGASLFLFDPEALRAEAAGGTGIEVTAEIDHGSEEPALRGVVTWQGLKALVTIEFAWGIVEYKREFKVVDGREVSRFRLNIASGD